MHEGLFYGILFKDYEKCHRIDLSVDLDGLYNCLRPGIRAHVFNIGLFLLNVVHDSCGGSSDAPQLAARVRRRRFTIRSTRIPIYHA